MDINIGDVVEISVRGTVTGLTSVYVNTGNTMMYRRNEYAFEVIQSAFVPGGIYASCTGGIFKYVELGSGWAKEPTCGWYEYDAEDREFNTELLPVDLPPYPMIRLDG